MQHQNDNEVVFSMHETWSNIVHSWNFILLWLY